MLNKKVLPALVLDLFLFVLAVILAVSTEWHLAVSTLDFRKLFFGLTALTGFLGSFFFFRVYRQVWLYAGVKDFLNLIYAVSAGTVFTLLLNLPVNGRSSWPACIFLGLAAAILLVGVRFLHRLAWEYPTASPRGKKKKVLIIGAGESGALFARTLKSRKYRASIEPVGFIDNDPMKQGLRLNGIPVLGTFDDIPLLVNRLTVDEAIIAIPTSVPEQIRAIAEKCRQVKVRTKILPGVLDLLEGEMLLKQVREVQMEDLLHRSEVETDLEPVKVYINGRKVLVTGAGGSIGSELCRQICTLQPGTLLMLGRGENSIHEISLELAHDFPEINCIPIIADIRDQDRIIAVFENYRPEVIFHTAAHKHVPLMEMQPEEAFKNNVFGTHNLAKMAHQFNTRLFVLISTDKAVNPSSIMGLTKLLAEMIVRYYARISPTVFTAVRFGNVLGSRGSVVHLFRRQIAAGGPVTVTHPEVTRYFMTIREAVQLVMQAGAMAQGGEVFTLDMGKPIKVSELAQDMIELSGLASGDIHIQFVGLRPGEKLHEELLGEKEEVAATRHRHIYQVKNGEVDCSLVNLVISVSGHPTASQVRDLQNLALTRIGLNRNY